MRTESGIRVAGPPRPAGMVPPPPALRPLSDGWWLWDEGASDPEYGGNKARKLAILLPDALGAGARSVLTVGGVGSHHVLATAILGRRLGLATHAVLFDQPDRPDVRAQRARIEAACASVVRVPTPAQAAARSLLRLRRLRSRGHRVAWIPPGGTSPRSVRGWRDAAAEVARRVRAGALPRPDRVVVALGTGGTAAGLLAGFSDEGLRTEVVAARVVPRIAIGPARVRALAGVFGGPVALTVVDALHGGYGAVDDEVLEALASGRARGVPLEPTYTAKAWAAARRVAAAGVTWFVATAPRPLGAPPG
jgi:D-cysteine desulfhydrase